MARKQAASGYAGAGKDTEHGPRRITSRNHQVVKEVRRLRRRTYRDRDGVFLVEGPNLLNEAANSGATIEEIVFVSGRATEARLLGGTQPRPPVAYEISDELLGWVSDVVTSQGILGVVRQLDEQFSEFEGRDTPLLLVANQVRDPGNLGALLRIADAAGTSGFVTTRGCVDLYNPKVVRAAAGSHFHMPLVRDLEMAELVAGLGRKGVVTVGLDAHRGTNYLDVDLREATAVLVGNEAFGFDQADRDLIDKLVCIEMPGKAESLNVASSAAIVMFEALRQRRFGS